MSHVICQLLFSYFPTEKSSKEFTLSHSTQLSLGSSHQWYIEDGFTHWTINHGFLTHTLQCHHIWGSIIFISSLKPNGGIRCALCASSQKVALVRLCAFPMLLIYKISFFGQQTFELFLYKRWHDGSVKQLKSMTKLLPILLDNKPFRFGFRRWYKGCDSSTFNAKSCSVIFPID